MEFQILLQYSNVGYMKLAVPFMRRGDHLCTFVRYIWIILLTERCK